MLRKGIIGGFVDVIFKKAFTRGRGLQSKGLAEQLHLLQKRHIVKYCLVKHGKREILAKHHRLRLGAFGKRRLFKNGNGGNVIPYLHRAGNADGRHACHNIFENALQLRTEEDGKNGGRSLVAAETVVVTGGAYGNAKEILISSTALITAESTKRKSAF